MYIYYAHMCISYMRTCVCVRICKRMHPHNGYVHIHILLHMWGCILSSVLPIRSTRCIISCILSLSLSLSLSLFLSHSLTHSIFLFSFPLLVILIHTISTYNISSLIPPSLFFVTSLSLTWHDMTPFAVFDRSLSRYTVTLPYSPDPFTAASSYSHTSEFARATVGRTSITRAHKSINK